MYLHKLRNNYPSKTSSDLFNNGFKHDIVKTYFFKLISVLLYDTGNFNMGVNNQVAFHSVLFFSSLSRIAKRFSGKPIVKQQ